MFFFSPSKFPSWKMCFWIASAHQVGSAEGWTCGWKRVSAGRRAPHGEPPWALPSSSLSLILEEKILRTFLRKRSMWEWFRMCMLENLFPITSHLSGLETASFRKPKVLSILYPTPGWGGVSPPGDDGCRPGRPGDQSRKSRAERRRRRLLQEVKSM